MVCANKAVTLKKPQIRGLVSTINKDKNVLDSSGQWSSFSNIPTLVTQIQMTDI